MIGLLDLPVEVRLSIYEYLFNTGKAIVDGGNQSEAPSLLSIQQPIRAVQSRSGQVLRTCRTVYFEAQPLLYAATQFVTLNQAFAGRLPYIFDDGSYLAQRIRHLVWQLSCDFMKHLYLEDVRISKEDLMNLESLEFRCQAENWKGSCCGAWVDEQAIVRSRQEMIQYTKSIQKMMQATRGKDVFVIEDIAQRARGKLVFRVQRALPVLVQNEVTLED